MIRAASMIVTLTLTLGPITTPARAWQAPSTPRVTTPTPVTAPATGEPKAAESKDAKALAELVITFTKAFDAGDSAALAALFTEDARVADPSGTTDGRATIAARFASLFADSPGAKLAIRVDSLRFPSPDVAVEEGRSILTRSGQDPEATDYTVVYVRQGGRWLQSSLRESPATAEVDSTHPHPVPEPLTELEWLVGDWVNEGQDAVVLTETRWSEDRRYLLRDFTVTVEGKPALKGTQRIAHDPSAKTFRSWVFDSEGGFSEGVWSREGDRWVIKSHGVHHDGQTASSTQRIARVGPTTIRWTVSDRTRGDEVLPGSDAYTMVRRPPAPTPRSAGQPSRN